VNRDSIIKGFAVLSAFVLVAFIGFVTVKIMINNSHNELLAEGLEPVTLDANMALEAAIDSLEMTWQKIQSHTFVVDQDPLHLGRVVKNFTYAKQGFKESDEEDVVRLTATVIDDNPKAIIKFNGKSYVVQVDQWLEKAYRVVSIEKKQVVLEGGGRRVTLINKPLQESDETGAESDYSNSGSEVENY
jgi:hypothetical protein